MPLMTPPKPDARTAQQLEKRDKSLKDIITPITHPEESQRAHLEEVIDTEFLAANALLAHVEGSEWTVNYYNQVMTDGSEANPQALSQDAVHQQYRLVVGMGIKVTSEISQQQNSEDGSFTVTGAATTLPGLTPITGDMFTADVGDGRVGLFTITSSQRMSMLRDTVYGIEYRMTNFLTAETEHDLSEKVVETRYFNKDYLLNGEDPFLSTSDHNLEEELTKNYYSLLEYYMQLFSSREFRTLLLPTESGELTSAYDPMVLTLFHLIIPRADVVGYEYPTVKQVGGDVETDTVTIWDALLKREPDLLRFAATRARLVLSKEFSVQPFFSSIAMTGIQNVVWPSSELTHREKQQGTKRSHLIDALTDDDTITYMSPDTIDFYPPDIDDYYVFSRPFYEGDTERMSKLEYIVDQYLDGDKLRASDLKDVLDSLYTATSLEKFYYIPVVLVLIKVFVRNL